MPVVPPPRRLLARYRVRGRHRSPRTGPRVTVHVRRAVLLTVSALMCLGAVAAAASTTHSSARRQAAGLPEATNDRGGPTPQASPSRAQPTRAAPSRASRTRQDPPPGKLAFGAEPLRYVQVAAAAASATAACAVTAAQATALTLAPTWPETSPEGKPPSPMTLSRYDRQGSLAGRGLFFHPGVGPWQLDSAGIGAGVTAADAMDSKLAAERMAPYLVGRYCGARNGGSSEAGARTVAWRDWYACRGGACDRAYHTVLRGGVVPVAGVTRYGGGQPRQCTYRGQAYPCLFVDPAAAEGANWWAGSRPGAAPAPKPFYVFRVNQGGRDHEVRYWLAAHFGGVVDVSATRPLGANARGGLRWLPENTLCDRTTGRGRC